MSAQEELYRRFLIQDEYLGSDKPVNGIEPLVSVTVATYQHVNYIEECLEGILMQNTSFSFEVIVGEDESDDGTREICKKYAEKHQDKIRLFLRDRRLSQYYENGRFVCRFNGIWNRMSARGKYFAWCEGDDYWTDPFKLQKQVDFLESNNDFVGIGTNYDIVDSNGYTLKSKALNHKRPKLQNWKGNIYILNELPKTLTVVYRNIDSVHHQSKLLRPVHNGDVLIEVLMRQHGKIALLDEVCGAYRSNPHSTFGPLGHVRKIETALNSLLSIEEDLKVWGIKHDLKVRIQGFYLRLFAYHFARGKLDKAMHYYKRITINNRRNWFKLIVLILYSYSKK